MGAIAEAMVVYAQPLLDQTDGSPEQMNKAFMFSSVCYNIGILPESQRAESIKSLQSGLQLSDEEFEVFCDSIVYPMLDRFDEMFPNMSGGYLNRFHAEKPAIPARSRPTRSIPTVVESTTIDDEPLPYAACPCNSGKKYKFCCKQSKSLTGVC